MDIIDIILARALTPQGQIEQYAATAQKAAADALAAASQAANAVDDAHYAVNNFSELSSAAEEIISSAQDIIDDIDEELNKISFNMDTDETENYTDTILQIRKPNEEENTDLFVNRLYNIMGYHTDGSMTQQAITSGFDELADYIDNRLANLPSGDDSNPSQAELDFGSENAGKILVVGDDGKATYSDDITETDLTQLMISSGNYTLQGVIGVEIDYQNKSVTRVQEAVGRQAGAQFNHYRMFSGRLRVNLSNDGAITARYGGLGYKEDGSTGQVMVYQPKFYYNRTILSAVDKSKGGQIIQKEILLLSDEPRPGFKLHPLFIDEDGNEIDYVFLPAYESCLYHPNTQTYDLNDSADFDVDNDQLSSIAGAVPVTGINKEFTIANAEHVAMNRGTGWHITNLKYESAMQMLMIVEYGTLNLQSALEKGIVEIPSVNGVTCASTTGSTTSLGNASGYAPTTYNRANNTYYDVNGKRAISYRGVENPWGNLWRMVGGVLNAGDGALDAGKVYIKPDYWNDTISEWLDLGFTLPNNYDWISNFGYGNASVDWAFIPANCSNANSSLPVGDNLWVSTNLTGERMCVVGGAWIFNESAGPFAYGFDQPTTQHARAYSARLMYIPNTQSPYYSRLYIGPK